MFISSNNPTVIPENIIPPSKIRPDITTKSPLYFMKLKRSLWLVIFLPKNNKLNMVHKKTGKCKHAKIKVSLSWFGGWFGRKFI